MINRHNLLIMSLGLVLLATLWAGFYLKVQEGRQAEIDVAVKEVLNLTRAFEEHSLRTIQSVDQTALFLKYQYEKEGKNINISAYIQEGQILYRNMVLLSIIDEYGELAVSSQVPFVPSNLADREHFLVHKENQDKGLFISKPVQGRSSGKWSIQMTRRIAKPDGSFGGVVVVSLDPYYFTEFYRDVDLGDNAVVALIGKDNIVRARLTGQTAVIGQDLSGTNFSQLVSAAEGYFIDESALDGIRRIYGYCFLAEYPFVVLVGVPEAAVLARVEERIHTYLLFMIPFSLLIVSFVGAVLLSTAKARRNACFLTLLNEVSLRMMDHQRVNSLLAEILRDLQIIADIRDAFIVLLAGNSGQITIAGGRNASLEGMNLSDKCCIIAKVRQAESPQLIKDCRGCPDRMHKVIFRENSRNLLSIPLRSAISLLGVLVVPVASDFSSFAARKAKEIDQFIMLASIALERTMIQEELIVAKEEAESANKAKGEFLANMSHEIRTPLNAVLGLAELLRQTELNTKQASYLENMTHSAALLLGLLCDILDFSKIEAGRLEIEKRAFNIEKIMAEVLAIAAVKAAAKGVELSCQLAEDVPRLVIGDALRLKQVLTNLIDNGVKFTARGTVSISVEQYPGRKEKLNAQDIDNSVAAADNGYNHIFLKFTVQDTGIGITAKDVKKLFQPFVQADAATTRKFGGTGIGLVISQKLIEAMGGEIQVISQPGTGTAFIFTILVGIAYHELYLPELNTVVPAVAEQTKLAAKKYVAAEVVPLLRELAKLLAASISPPVQLMTNLSALLTDTIWQKEFCRLQYQLENYELDSAEATVKAMLRAVGGEEHGVD